MATNSFSGILNRKAGMRNSSANSRVSNPVFTTEDGTISAVNADGGITVIATQRVIGEESEVATLSRAARTRATSRNRKAEADAMRSAAQEAEVLNVESAAKPEATPAPKKETTPKPEAMPSTKKETPYQVQSTAKRRATVKAQSTTTKPEAAPAKKPTTKKATAKPEAEPAKKPNLRMMMYSQKSLALFGDTKPIKEELKKIGGRYNPNLHPLSPDQSVPGWIFPLKAKEDLEALIANL